MPRAFVALDHRARTRAFLARRVELPGHDQRLGQTHAHDRRRDRVGTVVRDRAIDRALAQA
ncbi:MAG: hypothetical protein U0168_09945 [Nannocystaceae bacterium]